MEKINCIDLLAFVKTKKKNDEMREVRYVSILLLTNNRETKTSIHYLK